MSLISLFPALHQIISTPALLIDKNQMLSNVLDMQNHAKQCKVNLRPHCKTHKSADLAKIQLKNGAIGITVAKASEAKKMADSGIRNIFIANQITQSIKLPALRELHEKIQLIIGVDHREQINLLKNQFSSVKRPLDVRIEIDCGFGRCGIVTDDPQLLKIAQYINETKWLNLEGVYTHAGQAYAAKSEADMQLIAQSEAQAVNDAKQLLKQNGIEIATTSVGSTPTAKKVMAIAGVSEARPGNYIFYDCIQQSLGTCSFNQCSLFVLATVTAQPAAKRIICDAGSKALNLDRGAHAVQLLSEYGTLLNISGHIARVSEEHGIIELDKAEPVEIGSPLLIIPNHACVVANLYDKYHLINEDKSVQTLPISARGFSQ